MPAHALDLSDSDIERILAGLRADIARLQRDNGDVLTLSNIPASAWETVKSKADKLPTEDQLPFLMGVVEGVGGSVLVLTTGMMMNPNSIFAQVFITGATFYGLSLQERILQRALDLIIERNSDNWVPEDI